VRIPEKITKAWLEKNGYEIGTIYRNRGGHRFVIVIKRGRKWVTCFEQGPINGTGSRFKVLIKEFEKKFNPYVLVRGKAKRSAA
jgi:hypothetical protein|tara:strand:+ start:418 stop:669 length:252 start_codon:yes stop_codon:yes gene_type:complete